MFQIAIAIIAVYCVLKLMKFACWFVLQVCYELQKLIKEEEIKKANEKQKRMLYLPRS